MTYDVYMHFPVLAIMTLFVSAFLVTLAGKREKLRNVIAGAAVLIALALLALLIKPVMVDGEIIVYWMGNWEPVNGYAIGIAIEVDALSLFFGLLVAIAVACSCFYSYRYMKQDDARGGYFTLYLMLAGGVMGIVLSGDLFNIYVMLEVMTFAAVGLTAFRSWNPNAREAAFKYLVVGSIGSTCVLLGTALVYAQCHTLNLAQISALLPGRMNPTMIFPFHPIAADAHGAAPSSVSVLISGVFTKTGVYGIIRVSYFLFRSMGLPAMQTGLVLIGCLSMFVCVTMALNQHDFKRLLAFHSISQIGYILTSLGLCTALGIAGGLYHAINHTLFKGLLFLTAGAVLYATGTTYLEKLGGLARKMPQTAALFLIGAFSISGIPPFNGFYSKWLIYQATFEKAAETGSIGYALVTVVCVVTSVLTLASFIKVGQSVFFGQLPLELENVKETPLSMRIPMWIMAALCVFTGVAPNTMIKYIIGPATGAVINFPGYIDAAMGEGYAAANITDTGYLASPQLMSIGAWSPVNWLILFVVVLAAVFLVTVIFKRDRGPVSCEADSKHAVFFGGEVPEYSHVAGGDLFWGFKHNLRGYLGFMSRAHSGVTNDYVLWGVTALAVIVLYCFAFM
jgi:multicomponent Na+:H+ antiporter subunit D